MEVKFNLPNAHVSSPVQNLIAPQQFSPHEAVIKSPSRTITPFTGGDVMDSFIEGCIVGLAGLGILAVGAWLVGVMRKRVLFSSSS